MKTATIKSMQLTATATIPYPNAATKQEILCKFLDLLLIGAIGAGLAACIIFLLSLA